MRTASPDEFNGAAFDYFTFVHMASGTALALLGAGPATTVAASIAWEIAERPLKDHLPELFPHPLQDRPINIATDIVALLTGWGLGRLALGPRRRGRARARAARGSAWRW